VSDDSLMRKRCPIARGCFDYFHDALGIVFFMPLCKGDPAAVIELEMLEQTPEWKVRVAVAALELLQCELTGGAPIAVQDTLLGRFGDALMAIAHGSWVGNEKHNSSEPLHHARGKSMDHADCLLRHLKDRGKWDEVESGDGVVHRVRHSTWVAWRALALLQQDQEDKGAQMARNARIAN
jgi:hypothetical protein